MTRMNKGKGAVTVFLLSVMVAGIIPHGALAAISVGVKEGDWIDYEVHYIGTPSAGHDVVWARMEILKVNGTNITVKITAESANGTKDTSTSTLNLETGHIADEFIIPANLDVGSSFIDDNRGVVTITGTSDRYVAGIRRTVIYTTFPETTTYWDKATGVTVEGHAVLGNFTMITTAVETNMWQPTMLGFPPFAFLAFIVITLGIILVIVALLVFPRKKLTTQTKRNQPN